MRLRSQAAHENPTASIGEKLHHCQKKNLIHIARHFNHLRRKNACSSQDSFVYNESLQHPASWPHHQSFANKDSPFFSVDH